MAVPPPGLTIQIDYSRVRANAVRIARETGVPVIAVVKADAYGLGAREVVAALADLEEVEGFYTFTLQEAVAARIFETTGKPTLALEPHAAEDVDLYRRHGVRATVWTVEEARRLRAANPVLCVDTGMQRFAAPASLVREIVRAGGIREAMTHATRVEHVEELRRATAGLELKLHAAGSALLGEPAARLDAVRPGLALYRDAVRASARLVDARDSQGPAGYTGFVTNRHGLILTGYQHGLRRGPCLVNGRMSRLLEVGMQTAFVELEAGERVGDEVVLLGEGLNVESVAQAWSCGPHEVLLRLSSTRPR